MTAIVTDFGPFIKPHQGNMPTRMGEDRFGKSTHLGNIVWNEKKHFAGIMPDNL